MIIVYLIGAFIACFLSIKVLGPNLTVRKGKYDSYIEVKETWLIIGITLFYPIYVPLALMWKGLDFIYNKLTKTN